MVDVLFAELLESIREAGAIMRGEVEPSRVFRFDDNEPTTKEESSDDNHS